MGKCFLSLIDLALPSAVSSDGRNERNGGRLRLKMKCFISFFPLLLIIDSNPVYSVLSENECVQLVSWICLKLVMFEYIISLAFLITIKLANFVFFFCVFFLFLSFVFFQNKNCSARDNFLNFKMRMCKCHVFCTSKFDN